MGQLAGLKALLFSVKDGGKFKRLALVEEVKEKRRMEAYSLSGEGSGFFPFLKKMRFQETVCEACKFRD